MARVSNWPAKVHAAAWLQPAETEVVPTYPVRRLDKPRTLRASRLAGHATVIECAGEWHEALDRAG